MRSGDDLNIESCDDLSRVVMIYEGLLFCGEL